MGSLSLIILLIIVVWVIVLAPMLFGNNKPIRRSGEGFDETRVLHEGGTAALSVRRRPKLTAADVHRYADDEVEDYEVVEAVDSDDTVEPEDAVETVEDTVETVETAEVVEAAEAEPVVTDHAEDAEDPEDAEDAEIAEDAEADEQAVDADTYLAPEDFGYEAEPESEAEAEAAEAEDPTEEEATEEATEDDLAFVEARRGRGGYDPRRDARTRADRYQRRQRTFLGLIVASVISLTAAVVAGGWAWVLPTITIGLTLWFMVALRRVVKQERALRARRMRQLRRARLGVDVAQRPGSREGERMRAGAVILNIDDESPDFEHLPRYRRTAPDYDFEYDDYGRAS
ncbi:gephyrin-like molybdotransferase receptor GlpR [Corynebacterium sp. HMSC29G08]|uniref:divisome protein SepX/GlpR n=1 Tax=Corynebacterium sp. HMSC29G08 TaxID=1581069 RepID=UPI0008A38608|nr:gephyrin-like molybdotransferase receptor GlpR [Corynebacterium sp. HMSC29G08]OFT81844.1 hypothetical protein HMPREF3101_09230 [Corynebacterium sp. HMSC29G08]